MGSGGTVIGSGRHRTDPAPPAPLGPRVKTAGGGQWGLETDLLEASGKSAGSPPSYCRPQPKSPAGPPATAMSR